MATKFETIEVDLPQDIIFAMRGLKKREQIKGKLKKALAIILFQEKSISLGKASELAEMNMVRFTELLTEYGIPSYEYNEEDFKKDQKMITEYKKSIKK